MTELRTLSRAEARVVADLPRRFMPGEPLRAAHRRSLLSRFPEGIRELREAGRTLVRTTSIRAPRTLLAGLPLWERVADGGLGRTHEPGGDLLWVIAIEADPAVDDADVARALTQLLPMPGPQGDVAMAVAPGHVNLVQAALGPCVTRPLPSHFEVEGRRSDAVLLHWPGSNLQTRSPSPPVRVAAVQATLRREPLDRAVARYEELIGRAASSGAALAVLPEHLTLPLLAEDTTSRSLFEAVRALDAHREAFLDAMATAARTHRIAVVAGTHLEGVRGGLRNVAHVFDANGNHLGAQEKLHPTPYEAECFGLVPGDALRTFDVAGLRLAVAICYDAEFPEVGRRAKSLGAELLVVPYNTDTSAGHHRVRRTASARAVEGEMFVLTAGAVGRFEHRFDVEELYAASAIFCPSDRGFPAEGVLDQLAPNVEGVLSVTLERERLHGPSDVRPYRDRRDDV